jgi:hypothetical protein
MAVAVSNNKQIEVFSSARMIEATIVLDAAYPTGGSPGIAAALGFNQIVALIPLQSGGLLHEYLPASDKLKSYDPTGATAGAAGVEVPNGTNLSATSIVCLVFGN